MQVETTATVGLTIEQYKSDVRRLNLHPTNIPGLYVCRATGAAFDQTFNVKSPDQLTPEARAEFIEELKLLVAGY